MWKCMSRNDGVRITAAAATTGQTGVEMEALTAAAVAALTVYDMTKALDKSIAIEDLYLLEKTGGKSGDFTASAPRSGRSPDLRMPPVTPCHHDQRFGFRGKAGGCLRPGGEGATRATGLAGGR